MEDKIITLIKEGLKVKDMSKGEAALKLFNQALKLAQQAKHKELISICQNNIGLVYYEWGK
ncbi:MAG: hypothetical protein ACFFD2_03105 [Promethearchaeota archaeon]